MDPVLYWNSILLEASRRDFTRGFNNAQQPGPIRTSRAMAIVHLAIHDVVALRAVPGASWLEKKGIAIGFPVPAGGSIDDMIAGAAMTTLKALYPNYHGYFDDSIGRVNAAAFDFGVDVGNAILAARAGDGSDAMITQGQPTSPVYGEHRADPYQPGQSQLGPVWGNVTRFTGAAHAAMADFPGKAEANYLDDPLYLADFDEVRDFGAVVRGSRTAEQQRIGVYWGYDGAMNLGVPPRLYNQVVRAVAATRPRTIAQMAELFAMVNVAMADSGIDAWHYKYVHDLWRPTVGIRAEDTARGGDPFWAPLGAPQTNTGTRTTVSPNFPAYPSGHATFGAAMTQVLRLAFNGGAGPITLADVIAVEHGPSAVAGEDFTFVSDELDGISADPDGSTRQRVEKTFGSFAEAAWENSVSRIYLGVHWRFDGLPRDAAQGPVGGTPLGLAIGEEAHGFFNAAPSLSGSG